MKTVFRLYANGNSAFNSSVFDMIDGDRETKQTKGLAYIFKEYPEFLHQFLKQDEIVQVLRLNNISISWNKISSIEINAEKISASKKRADILVKIDQNKKEFIAIIIEAKSIKTAINTLKIKDQINNYLSDDEFPELAKYIKIPVILTKYTEFLENVSSITWNKIINLLHDFANKNSSSLLDQYFTFITGVDKSMKFYEKEVLSIPAGKTFELVEKYSIYECPDQAAYNYKKSLFITFRNTGGGVMNKLYKIEDILIFNPTIESELQRVREMDLSEDIKNRLFGYISESGYGSDLDHDKKFYILSTNEIIELKNQPHPKVNNAKFSYYRLCDILTESEVIPESQL